MAFVAGDLPRQYLLTAEVEATLARPDALAVTAWGARIDAAGRDERKARLADLMEWLLAWTADLARIRAGGHPERNPDRHAGCYSRGCVIIVFLQRG